MTHWFVVRTATRQEQRAAESLKELGIDHYLPQLTRWKRTQLTKEAVQAPLFDGYLFAQLGGSDFRAVLEAQGVHTIVKCTTRGGDRRPIPVSGVAVAALQDAQARGDFDYTKPTKAKYRPSTKGEAVRIIGGQFQGWPAQFVREKSREQVEVLMQIFGRWGPVTLRVDEIAAAA